MNRPFAAMLVAGALSGCAKTTESPTASAAPTTEAVAAPRLGPVIAEGIASRYADSLAGNPTASGEPYDPKKLTCAHRKLKLGTVLSVHRKKTGQTVTCTVNDRGPFHDDRVLDLSRAAAEALGFTGIARVEVREVLAEEGQP